MPFENFRIFGRCKRQYGLKWTVDWDDGDMYPQVEANMPLANLELCDDENDGVMDENAIEEDFEDLDPANAGDPNFEPRLVENQDDHEEDVPPAAHVGDDETHEVEEDSPDHNDSGGGGDPAAISDEEISMLMFLRSDRGMELYTMATIGASVSNLCLWRTLSLPRAFA